MGEIRLKYVTDCVSLGLFRRRWGAQHLELGSERRMEVMVEISSSMMIKEGDQWSFDQTFGLVVFRPSVLGRRGGMQKKRIHMNIFHGWSPLRD